MDVSKVQKFISEDQVRINGWFFPLDQLAFFELFLLQESLNISGDIAEIGVYQGKSLVMLSILKSAHEKLLGFDLFEGDTEAIAQSNLKNYGSTHKVRLEQGLTSDLDESSLSGLLPSPLRFLHIDAGHEYHEVLAQLHLFAPFMADTGIIAMDDYQDREFPGIEAAVLDFADIDRPRRCIPFLSSSNKLFLCFTPVATAFQKMLINRPDFRDASRLSRVRDFNVLIMRSKLPVESDAITAQLERSHFPRRAENELLLNQKAARFSQLSYGSGE